MKFDHFNQTFNIEKALANTKKQSLSVTEIKIIENYAQFLKKSSNKILDNTVFCVAECPKQFPFMNLDLFCSSKINDQYILSIIFDKKINLYFKGFDQSFYHFFLYFNSFVNNDNIFVDFNYKKVEGKKIENFWKRY